MRSKDNQNTQDTQDTQDTQNVFFEYALEISQKQNYFKNKGRPELEDKKTHVLIKFKNLNSLIETYEKFHFINHLQTALCKINKNGNIIQKINLGYFSSSHNTKYLLEKGIVTKSWKTKKFSVEEFSCLQKAKKAYNNEKLKIHEYLRLCEENQIKGVLKDIAFRAQLEELML